MHTCDAHFESDKQTMADAKTSCHKKLLAVLHCKNYCKIQLTSATAEYTILDRCLTLPKMLLKQVVLKTYSLLDYIANVITKQCDQ